MSGTSVQAKRWEFVSGDEIEIAPGRIVKRIRALAAIPAIGVRPGDLGGYVEHEHNLNQMAGDAWVSGNAHVYDCAWVSGDAHIYGNAYVYGNAHVYGNALIYGDAQVEGDAEVHGEARIHGDAQISGNAQIAGRAEIADDADWLLIGPAAINGSFITAHRDAAAGVRVNNDHISGSLADFVSVIGRRYANSPNPLAQYLAFCRLIASNFNQPNPTEPQ